MVKLWSVVRGAGRLVALSMVIALSVAAYVFRRSHRINACARARWLQAACRRALRVLAVEMDSHGRPAQGVVIAANHLSYLDIIVLASLTPVVFVSKREVRSWPVFGWFAEKSGTRFIDRTRRGDVARIGDELGAVIADGLSLVVFLEGTTTDGREVLPFKPSLLEPAIKNGWRVVPVGLHYEVPVGRSAGMEVCWWGDMTLLPHLLNFSTLSWVRARVGWGEVTAVAGRNRKAVADELRCQVIALKPDGSSSGSALLRV